MDPQPISEVMPDVLEKYQIQAIPTVHDGIQYRSRIEARWAVFFNALRLRYDYEPEGYNLGDGVLYLPDFWLPDLGIFVEIKGEDPNGPECEKAHRLAVAAKKRVYVFYGGHTLPTSDYGPPRAYVFYPDGGGDWNYLWCECRQCGRFGIEFEGRADRLPCKESHAGGMERMNGGESEPDRCKRYGGNLDRDHNTATPKLMAAYNAARAARFAR